MRKKPFDPVPAVTSPNALATGLAATQSARLRHVAAWKCWMAWDGQRWRRDDTLLATNLAREVCWTMASTVRKGVPPRQASGVIQRLGRAGTVAQVERLARADRHVAARPELFDADANLLNTPAGIVDLRTGALGPHRADAYLTRMTRVAPSAPDAPCPAWQAWLERMSGDDDALLFYLQRVAGRALVKRAMPEKRSSALPRSLFVETIARLLGDDRAEAALRECLAALPRAAATIDAMHDPELVDRLDAESPAILRWAIDGALAWRAQGLAAPDSVRQVIESGAGAGDALDQWLDETTERSTGTWTLSGDLYDAWFAWAALHGLDAGSQKRLAQALAARGFAPTRHHGGRRGFAGIRLRRVDASASDASPSVTPDAAPLDPRPPQAGEGGERSEPGVGNDSVLPAVTIESAGNIAPCPHPPIASRWAPPSPGPELWSKGGGRGYLHEPSR
jgi:phage/plasmid-associated DNA primase